jgi:acyl carrier protein
LSEQATLGALHDAVVFVLEVPDHEVTPDSTLDDLGIDSLTASQILIEIEIRLGREVDFELIESLDEVATLADFAAALDTGEAAVVAEPPALRS